jgi:predicted transposase/invertase (TIGR01784 family)
MMKKRLLSVKNDFVFKKLFGEPGNEDILKALLEAILGITFKKVEPRRDTVLSKDIKSDKTGILDVRATLDDDKVVNVEMQVNPDYNMFKRTCFYISKLYSEGLQEGQKYSELKKAIAINILSHDLLKKNRCHSIFQLKDQDNDDIQFKEIIEIHFIELPNINSDEEISERLSQWLRFINFEEESVIDMLSQKNKDIEKAKEKLEVLSRDEQMRIVAENRAKYLSDYNSNMAGAREEGLRAGLEQGIEKGIEQGIERGIEEGKKEAIILIVIKSYKNGMTVEQISEILELSIEEVKTIIEENNI